MTRRGRRFAVTLSVLIALVSGGGALALNYWPADAGPPVASSGIDTGVLSPRRAPEAFRALVADTRLASRVDVFARSLAKTSCIALGSKGKSFYELNATQPLIPASALKLTTAAAFLATVGGKGSFTTTVKGARPSSAGVVSGSLTLVGGGDPLLSTVGYVASRKHPPTPATDIGKLASKVYSAGVRHVTGGIVIDDRRYDTERTVPSWSPGYTTAGDVGRLGALTVDDGFTSYTPNEIASVDPGLTAGEAFRKALTALGVVVDGSTTRGVAAKTANEITSLASAPYSEVVAEMLRESDNETAEALLKELAHKAGSAPATRTAGVAARVEALTSLGVPSDSVLAIDGSGLDRSDRATCDALLATLTAKPGGFDLETMLAVAAQTGTLTDRFTASPLAGHLRAKTGSLDNVTALVGVTDTRDADAVRFAFVSNAVFTDAGGKSLQDRLVAALATYPEAPSADALAP